ncbi:hypothetical protein 015DV004_103 [Bacillus phage 015DV004]|nr:hypothetical protein 015DV004_103 [Bacillus phage 015DV004]
MDTIEFSDDELVLMITALQMAVHAHESYLSLHGEEGLDQETVEIMEDMKKLVDRLELEEGLE